VANVVHATLANREVFTHWHAQDAHVVTTCYKRVNEIPSLSSSDPYNL